MNDISIMNYPFNTVILLKNNTSWYESSLLSGFFGLLGVFVGFIINRLNDYLKEKADLDRYEYALLSKTKNHLEQDDPNFEKVDEFIHQLLPDLRFAKLNSSKLIFNSLMNIKEGNDYSGEKAEITKRLNYLKKGGIVSRIGLELKTLFASSR
ncbi:MAG: hypothetical protein M0Q13_08010 [Methanothrix sp.]|jgi:hypothetical protein|nr:hypothetical protein [Methanothrix sp.]